MPLGLLGWRMKRKLLQLSDSANRNSERPPQRGLSVFAAPHESAFGTKLTFHQRLGMSAFGGKADID